MLRGWRNGSFGLTAIVHTKGAHINTVTYTHLPCIWVQAPFLLPSYSARLALGMERKRHKKTPPRHWTTWIYIIFIGSPTLETEIANGNMHGDHFTNSHTIYIHLENVCHHVSFATFWGRNRSSSSILHQTNVMYVQRVLFSFVPVI